MLELTQEELARARSLQRKLRWLRRWDRIGKVVCWPWTFYKTKQQQMMQELTGYYDRWKLSSEQKPQSLHTKSDSIVDAYHRACLGNPLTIRKAKEELFRTLNGMKTLAESIGGRTDAK